MTNRDQRILNSINRKSTKRYKGVILWLVIVVGASLTFWAALALLAAKAVQGIVQ
jgi:cobalamin biosynthesis protein CobD/CbiB